MKTQQHVFLRVLSASFSIAILFTLCIALFAKGTPAHAQAEPTSIIDTVLRDLGQRLGRTLSRANLAVNEHYGWTQTNFTGGIDCPGVGSASGSDVVPGYIITVSLTSGSYEYRAKLDGSQIYFCDPVKKINVVVVGSAPNPQPNTNQGQPDQMPGGNGSEPASFAFKSPFAFVASDGNVVMTLAGVEAPAIHLTNDANAATTNTAPFYTEQRNYAYLRFSPDGTKLAFVEFTTKSLIVAVSGQKPQVVAQGIEPSFPPAWSADSREVAYAVNTQQLGSGADQLLQIQAVAATGGQPHYAGTIAVGAGCGGCGFFTPSTTLQLRENSRPLAGNQELVWLSQGFVHSAACSSHGLALTDFSGKQIWNKMPFDLAVVSPDRTKAIGFTAPRGGIQPGNAQSVGVIDLASGNVTPITLQPNADVLAWTADSQSILYSTITPLRQVSLNTSSQTAGQLFGGNVPPQDTSSNTVSLWRVPVAGGQSQQVFSKEGYAIGTIGSFSDSKTAAFSFITSDAAFYDKLNANAPVADALNSLPHIDVLGANVNEAASQTNMFTFATDAGKPAMSGVEFTAVSVGASAYTGGSGGGTISTGPSNPQTIGGTDLVVGSKARVLVDPGTSLNLRATPSAAAQVKRTLKSGEIVTILAGPQMAEGFRWWQVRSDTDGAVGWAVDEIAGANGQEKTMSPIQ